MEKLASIKLLASRYGRLSADNKFDHSAVVTPSERKLTKTVEYDDQKSLPLELTFETTKDGRGLFFIRIIDRTKEAELREALERAETKLGRADDFGIGSAVYHCKKLNGKKFTEREGIYEIAEVVRDFDKYINAGVSLDFELTAGVHPDECESTFEIGGKTITIELRHEFKKTNWRLKISDQGLEEKARLLVEKREKETIEEMKQREAAQQEPIDAIRNELKKLDNQSVTIAELKVAVAQLEKMILKYNAEYGVDEEETYFRSAERHGTTRIFLDNKLEVTVFIIDKLRGKCLLLLKPGPLTNTFGLVSDDAKLLGTMLSDEWLRSKLKDYTDQEKRSVKLAMEREERLTEKEKRLAPLKEEQKKIAANFISKLDGKNFSSVEEFQAVLAELRAEIQEYDQKYNLSQARQILRIKLQLMGLKGDNLASASYTVAGKKCLSWLYCFDEIDIQITGLPPR